MPPLNKSAVRPDPPTKEYTVEKVNPPFQSKYDYVTTSAGWIFLINFMFLIVSSYILTVVVGTFPEGRLTLVAVFVIAGLLNKYIHEPVHAFFGAKLGYTAEIDYHLFGGETKFHNQWMNRNDRIMIVLAPFLILSIAFTLVGVISPYPALSHLSAGFLILNSGGSVMDVTDAISTMRISPSSQIYTREPGESTSIWVAHPREKIE
jgi:hypothetical protein